MSAEASSNSNINNNSESTSVESNGLGALPRLSSIEGNLFDEGISPSSSSNGTCSQVPAAKEKFYMHLGGLIFLRFLCPALVVPHKMNLTPGYTAPSKQMQWALVLLAKLMQSLANNVEYTISTESFMVLFNSFLARNRPKLIRFYDQLCQQAQNDPRRESQVARSNAIPRLSHLWASRSSSSLGNESSIVNLTEAHVMESPDASCAILRDWMSSHLDYLAIEIADNNKYRRQQNIVVNNGSNSSSGCCTPPTTSASTNSASPVKPRPKRRLETSKNAVYPKEILEEFEDKTHEIVTRLKSKSIEGAKGVGALQRQDIAMPLSLEDLDKIMGHTSHRDSQLMKVYYAMLSQTGLQHLLRANDADSAEWTTYKSNKDVEDRLVEMKGHVNIRTTPEEVFQYMRSLENKRTTASGCSIDGEKMTVRKVEPLDESRTVLYREHSKLSLWPAWLVKPRNSCDLHSFVEKTGRPETYAVLQESCNGVT
ncbi:putative Rho GTPase activation protein [Plasmopara halstedii]